jgi:hypothetical protein
LSLPRFPQLLAAFLRPQEGREQCFHPTVAHAAAQLTVMSAPSPHQLLLLPLTPTIPPHTLLTSHTSLRTVTVYAQPSSHRPSYPPLRLGAALTLNIGIHHLATCCTMTEIAAAEEGNRDDADNLMGSVLTGGIRRWCSSCSRGHSRSRNRGTMAAGGGDRMGSVAAMLCCCSNEFGEP